MKTYRSVTAAALFAAVGTMGALSIGSALGQQGTQPGQRPSTQPGQTQPGERPTTQPGQTQPGQRPMTPGGSSERLFALEGAGAERQIQQLGSRLSQIEQQMERTNQELSRQITQAQQLDGEQKIDAITSVLEDIVNEHEQLHTYLVELRTAMTGKVDGTPGMNQPGQRPTTPPGQRPTTPSPSGQPGGNQPGGSPPR